MRKMRYWLCAAMLLALGISATVLACMPPGEDMTPTAPIDVVEELPSGG